MNLLLFKLAVAPILLTGTTLATRRWGPTVGGWLVGLPLSSGPISIFLALEHGPEFAAVSAHGSVSGLVAVAVFCLIYAKCVSSFKWPAATLLSLAGYFACAAVLTVLALPFAWSVGLVVFTLAFFAWLVKPVTVPMKMLAAPKWDLPFRMLAATALVLIITAASEHLGPELSGLLSTFPVFISVISAFSHGIYGASVTRKFERGVFVGSYAFTTFFVVVSLTIQHWPLLLVYSAALIAALCMNVVVYVYQSKFG